MYEILKTKIHYSVFNNLNILLNTDNVHVLQIDEGIFSIHYKAWLRGLIILHAHQNLKFTTRDLTNKHYLDC